MQNSDEMHLEIQQNAKMGASSSEYLSREKRMMRQKGIELLNSPHKIYAAAIAENLVFYFAYSCSRRQRYEDALCG